MATLIDGSEASRYPVAPRRRDFRLVRTQRVLQIILGMFWLLDAGLQFQPYMFGSGFTTTYLLNNAHNQPDIVRWIITNVGNFVGPHVAVWNTFFALIQVAIGLGLLFRRTVRPALAVSFFWAFGVWFFGEGLGQLLTGSASALTGAPGSVFLYGLIGFDGMATISSHRGGRGDGSERRHCVLGSRTGHRGSGDSAAGVVRVLVAGGDPVLAAEQPNPDVGVECDHGHVSGGAERLLPLSQQLRQPLRQWGRGDYLVAGHRFTGHRVRPSRVPQTDSVSRRGWPVGHLLLDQRSGSGRHLHRLGDRPELWASRRSLGLGHGARRASGSGDMAAPRSRLRSFEYPVLVLGSLVALVAGLFLSAAYPVAAQESTGTAMSGMTGMSGSSTSGSSGQSASTATCTRGNNGSTRSGLDVTNTPNMSMGAPGAIMNMNGADASAAAGLNTVKANWHYTGPALPTAFAQELLAQGANGPTDIHMAATGCAPEPTFSQQINATQYVQHTSQAVAGYVNPSQAVAAGYVPVSPTNYPVVYYVNPTIVAANAAAKRTLDPHSIDGLVYAQTPTGTEVLAAAMYILPTTLTTPPMPYGPLVQWHQRTDVCGPSTSATDTPLQITGVAPCPEGTVQKPTPYVTMVWQIPVAGGPLAIQPPDIQIVEASVMTSSGS